jgi:hypothetical protein
MGNVLLHKWGELEPWWTWQDDPIEKQTMALEPFILSALYKAIPTHQTCSYQKTPQLPSIAPSSLLIAVAPLNCSTSTQARTTSLEPIATSRRRRCPATLSVKATDRFIAHREV